MAYKKTHPDTGHFETSRPSRKGFSDFVAHHNAEYAARQQPHANMGLVIGRPLLFNMGLVQALETVSTEYAALRLLTVPGISYITRKFRVKGEVPERINATSTAQDIEAAVLEMAEPHELQKLGTITDPLEPMPITTVRFGRRRRIVNASKAQAEFVQLGLTDITAAEQVHDEITALRRTFSDETTPEFTGPMDLYVSLATMATAKTTESGRSQTLNNLREALLSRPVSVSLGPVQPLVGRTS